MQLNFSKFLLPSIQPFAASATPAASENIETIHVICPSHLDIGFTGAADKVEMAHKAYLDQAIQLCLDNPDFCYTIETTWILREWLKRTDDRKQIQKMIRLIRQGQIEVCGIHTIMHSSVASPEELNQMVYEARRFREELGIEIVSAMQNDVPGYPWSFPQILSRSGMKYMVTGINTILSGGLKLPMQDNPFYWEGLDGSKVLLFIQDGYCWPIHKWNFFKQMAMGGDLQEAHNDLLVHLDELKQAGYSCDSFLFMASPGDNSGPLHGWKFFEFMRLWNEAGYGPRLVASTPRRYFEYIEKKYGASFATYKGEWPASYEWDLVKERGPMSTTYYRRTQTNLPTAEKLLSLDSILFGNEFPRRDVEKCYEGLLLYGEHSAPEGHGEGGRLTRREFFWANQEHYNYANRSFSYTESLLERGKVAMAAWVTADSNKVIVFNPLAHVRTDTVRVQRTVHGYGTYGQFVVSHLRDIETGETVACDNITMSEFGGDGVGDDYWPCISFQAKNVPAFGYRVYEAVLVPKTDESSNDQLPDPLPQSEDTVIENEKYRVEVDPATGGIRSIFDKEIQRNLVQPNSVEGTSALFNTIASSSPLHAGQIEIKRVTGATFQRLEIRRPGTWFPETQIRLDINAKHIEITNTLDRVVWRQQNPGIKTWSAHLQFPFRIKADTAKAVVSGPIGFRRIPEDLLPGAPNNTWPSSAFVSLDDGETCVMVSSPIDYLFLPGEKHDNLFMLHTQIIWQAFEALTRSAGNMLLPYTEPEQEGKFVRRYAITSRAGSFDAKAAQQFGWGFRHELLGLYVPTEENPKPGKFSESARSLLQLSDDSVSVLTLRRSLFPKQDYHILRLQEMTGQKSRKLKITFAPELGLKWAATADLLEHKGRRMKIMNNSIMLKIGPFETATIALGFQE